jgi:hypothetical protein
MKISRTIASLLPAAALLLTMALPAVAANPKPAPNPAPAPAAKPAPAPVPPEKHAQIHEALESLRSAKQHLEHAAHDFGGRRVEAIHAIDEAIHQLEICMQYDKD